jgi:excisionase family DNA binding protein
MYKVSQVAQEFNVSAHTIGRWIREEKIKAIKLPGGTYRIPTEEMERIRSGTQATQAPPQNSKAKRARDRNLRKPDGE